jgi:alpha-glucosidase
MKWALAAAAMVATTLSAAGAPVRILATVTSTDGRTAIEIRRHPAGEDRYWPLVYHVTRDGKDVIVDSPLGIRRGDQDFDPATLTLVGATNVRAIDERYTLRSGKAREHHAVARERTLHFKNPAGAPIDITLRAQNDGVAFRYQFPDRDGVTRTVVAEQTGFRVPKGSTAWMLPRQAVGTYAPAYEDLYRQVTAGTSSDLPDGWDLPALFRTPGGKWALVTESALDERYCGSHLAQRAPDETYRIAFPSAAEGNSIGKAQPESTLPWTLPWRLVIVGDRAGDIIESNLVTDVAPSSKIGTASWVKPGRAAWSWWSMSDSPKHAEQLNAFTDLAAEMGWEYALVDANWNLMQSGTIEDVVAHANEKNVGLLFWYNSGGPHNTVTEAPRDRMSTHEQRVKEFTQLKAWGVKGVKVDFWQSDKQDRIAQYRDLLRDAADFQLMVDFHGSTIPRGWEREFPNLIGMEAVAGAEQYKFRKDYAAKAPWLNTVLPFTRNAIGPMDFTPVTFSDAKYPHVTTNAHELALSVMFEDGIQHFADGVESYRAQPEAARTFLKQVPAAWDETRVLSGEPVKQVVIARRDGGVWYVGAINGTDEQVDIDVPLAFLKDGQWWDVLIRDDDRGGPGERRLTRMQQDVPQMATGSMHIPHVRPHGGFVMRFERVPPR